MFYGKGKCLKRISFGGSSQGIHKSYETAMEFINRLRLLDIAANFEYKLSQVIENQSLSKTGGCPEASGKNSVTS